MTNSTAQSKTWKWASDSYIVALHLLVAVLIVKTELMAKEKATHEVVASPNPHVINMLKYHHWMDESVPDKAAIFLGDSITQGLATAAVAAYSVNYGIGSENTSQLLDAIPSYKSLARADAIFLAIGINDLAQGKKAGLGDRYRKIVEALPGKTPLIWSAVMPVSSNKIALPDIHDANQTIKRLCSNRGNCVFVDSWKYLADKNGQMNSSLFLNDGIHLSPAGYSAWIPALKQAIQHFSSAHDAPSITRNAGQ